jgi:hypothetical protein
MYNNNTNESECNVFSCQKAGIVRLITATTNWSEQERERALVFDIAFPSLIITNNRELVVRLTLRRTHIHQLFGPGAAASLFLVDYNYSFHGGGVIVIFKSHFFARRNITIMIMTSTLI